MEIKLGFYSHVNTKPKATEYCLASVRQFYNDNKIVISCDGAFNFTAIAAKYNAICLTNSGVLGYPVQPYGYQRDKMLEWLDRMYRGVLYLKDTDYFVMLEDDVVIINPITIEPGWEMAGQPLLYEGQVPLMPATFLDIIEKFCGVRPKQNFYNCGGGSIFKTDTFLNNYENVRAFFSNNVENIQNTIYPTLGWMDCFMCVFYLLCGKPLAQNSRLYNGFPIKIPFDMTAVPPGTEILHNFKDYYD